MVAKGSGTPTSIEAAWRYTERHLRSGSNERQQRGAAAATLILADDHPLIREGLRSILADVSAVEVVAEADNGHEAIALVLEHKPSMIIMDVSMPDLNGVEATRSIVEIGPDTKVLALSAHRDEALIKGMLQAGASGYLPKECAADELITAIQTVLEGRFYISASIANVVVSDFVVQPSGAEASEKAILSLREREVLQLIADGVTTAEMADRLHLSVKTIESHRKNLMDKLEVRNIAGLTKYAIRLGLATLDV